MEFTAMGMVVKGVRRKGLRKGPKEGLRIEWGLYGYTLNACGLLQL